MKPLTMIRGLIQRRDPVQRQSIRIFAFGPSPQKCLTLTWDLVAGKIALQLLVRSNISPLLTLRSFVEDERVRRLHYLFFPLQVTTLLLLSGSAMPAQTTSPLSADISFTVSMPSPY